MPSAGPSPESCRRPLGPRLTSWSRRRLCMAMATASFVGARSIAELSALLLTLLGCTALLGAIGLCLLQRKRRQRRGLSGEDGRLPSRDTRLSALLSAA